MEHKINLSISQELLLHTMLADSSFWPGNLPPKSADELITWAITDYFDYYMSFMDNKGGK